MKDQLNVAAEIFLAYVVQLPDSTDLTNRRTASVPMSRPYL